MKKNKLKLKIIISNLFLLLSLSSIFLIPDVFAQESNPVSSSELFKPAGSFSNLDGEQIPARIQPVRNLPGASEERITFASAVASVIKILLNIAGALALLGFTIAGTLMIIGTQGKEEYLKKGKDLMKASIAGLIVIAISYALVIGVSSLEFFTPGATVSGGSQSNTTP